MEWESSLIDICKKNDIIIMRNDNNECLLVVPKMPNAEVQNQIKQVIPPEFPYRFIEAPKPATTLALQMLFMQLGAKSTLETEGHYLTLQIASDNPALTEENSEVLQTIKSLMKADAFVEGCKAFVNGQLMLDFNRRIDAALASRTASKERFGNITDEDLMDLQIILETSNDVNDLINSL